VVITALSRSFESDRRKTKLGLLEGERQKIE
jgi:hypothetical protein